MTAAPNPRAAWALAAAGAAAGAALAQRNFGALFDPAWPSALACAVLCAVLVAGAVGGERAAARLSPAIATLRLTLVLTVIGTWRGEAREFWGAVAAWVAWRDAAEGLCATRPLVPAATGLVVSLAWSAHHDGAAPGRAVLVALVAALAAAHGDRLRRGAATPVRGP